MGRVNTFLCSMIRRKIEDGTITVSFLFQGRVETILDFEFSWQKISEMSCQFKLL